MLDPLCFALSQDLQLLRRGRGRLRGEWNRPPNNSALISKGHKCGGKVVRVLETSENRVEDN